MNPDNIRIADTFINIELKRLQELDKWGIEKSLSLSARHDIYTRVQELTSIKGDINLDLAYNIPFWVQHKLRSPSAILRYDSEREWKILERVDSMSIMPFTGIVPLNAFISWSPDKVLWRWFVQNMDQVLAEFEGNKSTLEILKSGENMLVISNHATWANLVLLAFCFHYVYGIPREQLYTMVGPAIFTNEFNFQVGRHFSNLIKTWPQTDRANTGYSNINNLRRNALKEILSILKQNGWLWKVVFLAPSATSDDLTDGQIWLHPPSDSTVSLMERIAKGAHILPIGVNDTEIFKWGAPTVGRAFAKVWRRTKDVSKALQELPTLVRDRRGRVIGKWRS